MLKIEIEIGLGKMVCCWEAEAALMEIRPWIRGLLRDLPEPQKNLDELMIKAGALFEKRAPQVFHDAQARIVIDVLLQLMEEALLQATGGMTTKESKRIFTRFQKQISEFFKVRHNELLGHRRGRQAGQKYANPRKRQDLTAVRRKKILAAMREIGRAPFNRGEVARLIGIDRKTLRAWAPTKDEWEELSVEALSMGSRK